MAVSQYMDYAELQHFLLQAGDRYRLTEINKELPSKERVYLKYAMLRLKLNVYSFNTSTREFYRRLIEERFCKLRVPILSQWKIKRLIRKRFKFYFTSRAGP